MRALGLVYSSQYTIQLFDIKGRLPSSFQFCVHQDPHILFCNAASQTFIAQHFLVHGIIHSHLQGFAFALVEPLQLLSACFSNLLRRKFKRSKALLLTKKHELPISFVSTLLFRVGEKIMFAGKIERAACVLVPGPEAPALAMDNAC